VPACPEWLGDAERDEWDRLAPVLREMGLLTVVDADAFSVYVATLARWKKANRELHEQGLLLERKSGGRYVNPLVRVIAQCEGALHRAASMFGLSPADRQRIEVDRAKPVDELDQLLDG
jgi:P27 family predicted phage terminase small subunit